MATVMLASRWKRQRVLRVFLDLPNAWLYDWEICGRTLLPLRMVEAQLARLEREGQIVSKCTPGPYPRHPCRRMYLLNPYRPDRERAIGQATKAGER